MNQLDGFALRESLCVRCEISDGDYLHGIRAVMGE